jgi:hypothetical protein
MRLAIRYIKKITILLFFVSFMFVTKKARDYIFSLDGYSCKFDNLISCSCKNKIFNFVNLNEELKSCSLKSVSEKIKDKFCFIRDIEVHKAANGILSLNILGLQPKYILNGGYILAENKAVFEKDLFSKKALEGCKPVVLKDLDFGSPDLKNRDLEKEVSESCRNMIFRLPDKYFQEYEIIRESSAKSYMLDKTNKNFSILFNDSVIPDDRLLAYCLYIKNELQNRGEFNRKVPKNWFTDIRFKDQVVVVFN